MATLFNYEILEEFGDETTGKIFLAKDITTHQTVVIKQLPLSAKKDNLITSFYRGVDITKKLSRPEVVKSVFHQETDDIICLVLECMEGEHQELVTVLLEDSSL